MTVDTLTDLQLERAVVGRALMRPHDLGDMLEVLTSADFVGLRHAAVWSVVEFLHQHGRSWDVRDVADALATRPGHLGEVDVTPLDLTDLIAGAVAGWGRSAERLIELRARRQLRALGHSLAGAAEDARRDVLHTADYFATELGQIDTATEQLPDCLLDGVTLAYEESETVPWVVPGLLRRQHRAIVVGFEGHGKTTLLSQIAWCAAQGLHPFLREHTTPVRVLHVDLENPRDRVTAGYRPLAELCRKHSRDWAEDRIYVHHRPDGMDLRSRRDRGQLDVVLRNVRPDLVVLGPLRKTYARRAGENDEHSSLEVQAVFDDLRTRHDFALLLEHHAPHGESRDRKARPFGSSTWLGWSEFGFGMQPEEAHGKPVHGIYTLARWREDRVQARWPIMLTHGRQGSWPWDGTYPDGLSVSKRGVSS